uniref:Acyltransferase n=1 Tax=Loxodonta africana TaxID=9785 RepID=G3ST34_LOXAF
GTGSSILSALQDLFSITWLNRSKVEKQLQIFSVLQWVLTFLMLGMAGSIIFMYTFCTDCWLISVLYFTWLVFDWNTPKKGGRRSEWVRNWAVWRYFRDYFPVQLVKTHNLLTTRNYILGSHPHGIMGLGIFCNFGTEATEVSKKFAGIRPYLATLAGNFRMPVLREYLMSGGICPVKRGQVEPRQGHSGQVSQVYAGYLGGAEIQPVSPGLLKVRSPSRKAKIHSILEHGRGDSSPSLSPQELRVFQHIRVPTGTTRREILTPWQSFVCLFNARSDLHMAARNMTQSSYRNPQQSALVGEPITIPKVEQPTQKDIDLYHSMYMEALVKLFDNYKTKFGLPETEVLEVN